MLDIVLDNRSGLIRFAVEPSPISFSLHYPIGDLVPKDGSKTIQPKTTDSNLNISVQRKDIMASAFLARNAYVPHNTANTSSWYENTNTLSPNFVKFVQESLVIFDIGHLADTVFVFL
jgi:hypothetical protein